MLCVKKIRWDDWGDVRPLGRLQRISMDEFRYSCIAPAVTRLPCRCSMSTRPLQLLHRPASPSKQRSQTAVNEEKTWSVSKGCECVLRAVVVICFLEQQRWRRRRKRSDRNSDWIARCWTWPGANIAQNCTGNGERITLYNTRNGQSVVGGWFSYPYQRTIESGQRGLSIQRRSSP